MVEDNRSSIGRGEIESLLATMGEKAEHTPRPKSVVLEEVLEARQRKSRNLLYALLIGIAILGVLFYFAVKKYYSQF